MLLDDFVTEVQISFLSGSRNILNGHLDEYQKVFLREQGVVICDKTEFVCKNRKVFNELIQTRIYKILLKDRGTVTQYPEWFGHDLGRILSYPPKAVDVFCDSRHPDRMKRSISVYYCGIEFLSFESTILDDIQWLYDNRPVTIPSLFSLVVFIMVDKSPYLHTFSYTDTYQDVKEEISKTLMLV